MEQIVKIFVHQSYFIENDLVIDYNVEQGALANISNKDWIALIPKGWSGVDDQVAFKTVDTDCDVLNLAIKSIIIEKTCFQNVVECEKYYQLMYISQYLEILGRSEYFSFFHKSGICDCLVPNTKKPESKECSGKNKLSSIINRKTLRRQSPTPHEFYKNRPQSQNNVKSEKSKPWSTAIKCTKCNAPNNFTAVESAYLAKIQDLTINNENMEEQLMKLEKDLINTLEVINKLFKFNKTILQQNYDIQKFIDDLVDGLLKDGKVSFWARDQEFSIVREYLDENEISLLPDDITTILPINRSLNSSKEEYLKAVIGQQEHTIQNLVNKIKDMSEIFLKVNTDDEQDNSVLSVSKNKINNIGYMDISGTTYFSPPPCIANTLNDISLYSPKCFKKNIRIENTAINKQIFNPANSTICNSEYPDTLEPKLISTLQNGVEDGKNDNTQIPEKTNGLEKIKRGKNCNLEESDDSL